MTGWKRTSRGERHTRMFKQMLIGGPWRFQLCRRRRRKKICADAETQTAQTLIWNAHISTYTNTPAGAAVPTESGWRNKCAPKARLKGSLREERLWQKCTPRDFLIPLAFVFIYANVRVVHSAMHMFNFHASRLALLLGLSLTHTLSLNYFRPINPIHLMLEII